MQQINSDRKNQNKMFKPSPEQMVLKNDQMQLNYNKKKRAKKLSQPSQSQGQQQSQTIKLNSRKQIIKNFIEEGKRLGQIFKQSELEYKTFLVEGQKIKGFDRHQFAYWNGYLMSLQNLYSIFEFEGKLREFEIYVKELRDWETIFLKMLEEQQQIVHQNKNLLSVGKNISSNNANNYMQNKKGNQNFKYIQYEHNQAELSMIMEQSSRNEIDQSQNFELIRKSMENSKDITMIKIMENYTEEDFEEDVINQNDGQGTVHSYSDEETNYNSYYSNNNNSNNNVHQHYINHNQQHGFQQQQQQQQYKGLQLPESQKIQLHPNLKNTHNQNCNGNDQDQNNQEKQGVNKEKNICKIF